jgi:hypothetical protein
VCLKNICDGVGCQNGSNGTPLIPPLFWLDNIFNTTHKFTYHTWIALCDPTGLHSSYTDPDTESASQRPLNIEPHLCKKIPQPPKNTVPTVYIRTANTTINKFACISLIFLKPNIVSLCARSASLFCPFYSKHNLKVFFYGKRKQRDKKCWPGTVEENTAKQ